MIADFTTSEFIIGVTVTLLVYVMLPAAVLFFLTWAIIRKCRRK
jgi:hypothetical protein